jgi:tRNA (cytidine/uridine-2'-O-)-methyltransferase
MNAPVLEVVLHEPEIPFNAGNVGRTCVAIGARLWLVKPLGFQIDSRHIRRAGLDYWEHLNYEVVDDWASLTGRLKDLKAQRRFWFLTKRAQRIYTTARFQKGDVIVLGRESSGLPEELIHAYPEQCLRIPMNPVVRSLNLSASMAVVAYEAVRQFGG